MKKLLILAFAVLLLLGAGWGQDKWGAKPHGFDKYGSGEYGSGGSVELEPFNVTDNGGEVFRVTDNGGEDYNVK